MTQVNSLSVLVVRSGGGDKTFHILQTLAPGQPPARCSIYTVIVICKMADPWLDVMKTCLTVVHLFSEMTYWFFLFVYPIDARMKSIIFPVKSSINNRLVKGAIREGCQVVAWDIAISRPLTGLRILCNENYLRQLCPVPGLCNQ